jgi:hypothetical protein
VCNKAGIIIFDRFFEDGCNSRVNYALNSEAGQNAGPAVFFCDGYAIDDSLPINYYNFWVWEIFFVLLCAVETCERGTGVEWRDG